MIDILCILGLMIIIAIAIIKYKMCDYFDIALPKKNSFIIKERKKLTKKAKRILYKPFYSRKKKGILDEIFQNLDHAAIKVKVDDDIFDELLYVKGMVFVRGFDDDLKTHYESLKIYIYKMPDIKGNFIDISGTYLQTIWPNDDFLKIYDSYFGFSKYCSDRIKKIAYQIFGELLKISKSYKQKKDDEMTAKFKEYNKNWLLLGGDC